MKTIITCSFCPTETLKIISVARLEKMRAAGGERESQILHCEKCNGTTKITSKVEAALKQG